LERWYDVSFVLENLISEKEKELKVTGKFKDQNLVAVLDLLSHALNFEYTIHKKIVTLRF
jgi:hypothetical protein